MLSERLHDVLCKYTTIVHDQMQMHTEVWKNFRRDNRDVWVSLEDRCNEPEMTVDQNVTF